MKERAVFFATLGMLRSDDLAMEVPSATINVEEWKALRLLTLAGYTIVLFTPESTAVYAECPELHLSGVEARPPSQDRRYPARHVTPLLEASATLQVELADSWIVGDRLDTIEVGRLAGCKTILWTGGHETEWEMTVMRWPDLIGGDIWEIACLIVMSDGSSVDGLMADIDDEE